MRNYLFFFAFQKFFLVNDREKKNHLIVVVQPLQSVFIFFSESPDSS